MKRLLSILGLFHHKRHISQKISHQLFSSAIAKGNNEELTWSISPKDCEKSTLSKCHQAAGVGIRIILSTVTRDMMNKKESIKTIESRVNPRKRQPESMWKIKNETR